MRFSKLILWVGCLALGATGALAQSSSGSAADLAKQLANPVSSLISVPFEYNYNSDFGGGDAEQGYINIQPVVPISISENWNLISRTILPVVTQNGFLPNGESQLGFGNTTQSFFFSPKKPTSGGIIWGMGPVISIPTATDGLGNKQWGAGGTGVVLRQKGQWTVGILANQLWSASDEDKYGSYRTAFVQPFVSYTSKSSTTYAINTESTYNWDTGQWAVPINMTVAQLIKIGNRPVQIGGGVRYWAESPTGGAEGWGARFFATYLFPKKG